MKKLNMLLFVTLFSTSVVVFAETSNGYDPSKMLFDETTRKVEVKQSKGMLQSKVIKVYDGDTFTIEAKDKLTNTNYRVRILGIDTPELGWRAKCAEEGKLSVTSREFLKTMILGKTVNLSSLGKDKYGRLLANVSINETDVGTELLKNKLAVVYGKTDKKPVWCDILRSDKFIK
jgi:endonuclease YncB( thermonuclease family)